MELKDQVSFSSTENIKNKSYSKDFKDQVIAVYKSGVYETINLKNAVSTFYGHLNKLITFS